MNRFNRCVLRTNSYGDTYMTYDPVLLVEGDIVFERAGVVKRATATEKRAKPFEVGKTYERSNYTSDKWIHVGIIGDRAVFISASNNATLACKPNGRYLGTSSGICITPEYEDVITSSLEIVKE